jgi:hypothetical protein
MKTKHKKHTRLTDKQKAAADNYLANPKLSKTEAVMRSYNTPSRKSATSIASRVFNKPQVLEYLDEAASRAEQTIIRLMKSDNDAIALKAAQDILDRTKGKATQRTISESQTVTITADFTGGSSTGSDGSTDSPEAAPATRPASN